MTADSPAAGTADAAALPYVSDSLSGEEEALSDEDESFSGEDESLSVEDESLSYAGEALREQVHDSIAVRPSWVYYQYALEAMERQEWILARRYLDESLHQLVAEKFDSLYHNAPAQEDSVYNRTMPYRIVQALGEVFPNEASSKEKMGNSQQKEGLMTGVDGLEESDADSASLEFIEDFLDTLDRAQFTLPIVFNDRVMQEIYYMTNDARRFTQSSLSRKTAYDSLIYAKMDEMGVPRDLIYLALVESGFKVKAYSRAKASGMWQFIPETGKNYGLEVDYWVDMRRNPELATEAALKYLKNLYDEFHDWLLAMAAYNCGEGRIRRLLKEMKSDSTRSGKPVTYWDLQLPQETMRYVPRILASMVVGHFPEHYGMKIKREYTPAFDTVTVFDSFSLKEVARYLQVSEETLRSLNMELLMWCTPPNQESYLLRLPVGTREAFVLGYDKIGKNNFSGWVHHKIKRGENLETIALQYGITTSELQQANDMKGTNVREGQSILVPVKGSGADSAEGNLSSQAKVYVAKLGDNLGTVARQFKVSQESLRLWNFMEDTDYINVGDTIFVSRPLMKPVKEVSVTKTLKKGEKYVVQSGETFASIAKTVGIPVGLLMGANNGFVKRLAVGDSLIVPKYVKPKKIPRKVENSSAQYTKTGSQRAAKKTPAKKAPPKPKEYIVETGDNLSYIAMIFGTTVAEIQKLNGMGTSVNIYIGQKLLIPPSQAKNGNSQTKNLKSQSKDSKSSSKDAKSQPKDGKTSSRETIHLVQHGESLWDIARQYKVTIEDILRWNNRQDTKLREGDKLKIKR